MPDRPNILLITTDTQRCDTLACLGYPHTVSPNLDRLAREGMLFANAHTASPVCLPARCSLLTGVHTPIHGAIENGIRPREHLTVFPDLLRAAGYTNILVGKAHFGPVPDSFAVQITVGEKLADVDDAYGEHLRRHGYARPSHHPNPIPEELFMEAFLIDATIRELERVGASRNGPFFAFCSLVSPHEPPRRRRPTRRATITRWSSCMTWRWSPSKGGTWRTTPATTRCGATCSPGSTSGCGRRTIRSLMAPSPRRSIARRSRR